MPTSTSSPCACMSCLMTCSWCVVSFDGNARLLSLRGLPSSVLKSAHTQIHWCIASGIKKLL